jgi:hypothetical protein
LTSSADQISLLLLRQHCLALQLIMPGGASEKAATMHDGAFADNSANSNFI